MKEQINVMKRSHECMPLLLLTPIYDNYASLFLPPLLFISLCMPSVATYMYRYIYV